MRKPIQVAFKKLPTLPAGEKHKPGQPHLHIERKRGIIGTTLSALSQKYYQQPI
jgi:hypothetical protein